MVSTSQVRPFNLLSSRYFWALFLIGTGLLLMLAEYLRFSIPIFRLVVTLFLISAGVQLILKAANFRPKTKVQRDQALLLGSGQHAITFDQAKHHYYTLLGSQILDLRDLQLAQNLVIDITTILGETHLYLPRRLRIELSSKTFFGHISGKPASHSRQQEVPALIMHLHTIMGNVTIHREA